jgi:hypothetical protein
MKEIFMYCFVLIKSYKDIVIKIVVFWEYNAM